MITIQSSPAVKINPAYNPIYFEVSSNNTTQPNFQYVFQLYTGATLISTVNLLPRPNTAWCLFNPSRILQSYVGYDLGYQTITGMTSTSNNVVPFTVQFGESYGLLSTGTTVYSGLASSSNIAFNSVLSYNDYPNWPTIFNNTYYNDYNGSPKSVTSLSFLTNQPRSGVYVNLATDRGCVAVFSPFFANSFYSGQGYSVSVTHSDHSVSSYSFNNPPTVSGDIMYIPSGPWNLNNTSLGQIVDVTSDLSYTIQGLVNVTVPLHAETAYTESITYLIDQNCTKYTPVRIMFMNRWGNWDFFNFSLVSIKTVNISNRGTYQKTLPFNYTVGARQTTVLDIDGNYNYELTSNWINDATSSWLEELVTSPEIYIIDSSGNAKPMQLVENSYLVQTSLNNHLFNVTFNLTTSYLISTQHN